MYVEVVLFSSFSSHATRALSLSSAGQNTCGSGEIEQRNILGVLGILGSISSTL